MSEDPYAVPKSISSATEKVSRHSVVVSILIQVFWVSFITFGGMGLISLAIISSLTGPISPGQLGYVAGGYTFWVFIAAVVLVRLAAVRGWLPGVQVKRRPA
jgi:hypothetical protein